MTFGQVVDRQADICSWIEKNFSPAKAIRNDCGSMFLLGLIKWDIPDIGHEEFKQAMARCGYYGDCSYCDEHYVKVFFNVSQKSINILRRRRENEQK